MFVCLLCYYLSFCIIVYINKKEKKNICLNVSFFVLIIKMAESTKVRLVRCPKCENLLPELADYSVYQCGGCGAVLRGT